MKKLEFLEEILNGLLIILFLYTATSKLIEHATFKEVLLKSPLIGKYAWLLWWTIPVTEVILVLLLLFRATRLIGQTGALFLLTGFTAYIIYMVFYVPHLPCGCGGVLKTLSWREHIYFNLFFISAALAAVGLRVFITYRGGVPP